MVGLNEGSNMNKNIMGYFKSIQTFIRSLFYERIKKKVMEMSLEDLRDYVIYQMIEDENKYDPNYDDEEFFDW
jgi:hypothetical protein